MRISSVRSGMPRGATPPSASWPGTEERRTICWRYNTAGDRWDWIDLATRYDLDGIHHDFIRLPTSAFDYSRSALERFREWVKPLIGAQRYAALVAASHQDPYAFADSLPDQWDQFRRHGISDLVGRIYRDVKAQRPYLLVSAAVLPEWRSAARWHFQAWASWLAEDIIDVAVPMAYTSDTEEFTRV